MNTLNQYLQNDLEELIKAINDSEELQNVKINTTFQTLGDFASYWDKHLDNIKRTNQNNGQTIEYR